MHFLKPHVWGSSRQLEKIPSHGIMNSQLDIFVVHLLRKETYLIKGNDFLMHTLNCKQMLSLKPNW